MISEIIKNSLLSFWRYPLRCFGAIFLIGLIILFAGVLTTISENTNDYLRQIKESLAFEIYLQDNTTPVELLHLTTTIKSLPGYRSYQYHKSEETYKQMQQTVGNSLLPDNGFNPFPDMIVVSFQQQSANLQAFQEAEEILRKIRSIEDINYGKEWFTEQEPLIAGFNKFTNYISLLAFLIALLVIFWTIRGIATANKFDTYLLDLLGSGWRFLELPYMIQGALLSTIGTSLGLVFLYFAWRHFLTSPIELQFISNIALITIIVTTSLAGLLSATIAIRSKLQ